MFDEGDRVVITRGNMHEWKGTLDHRSYTEGYWWVRMDNMHDGHLSWIREDEMKKIEERDGL